MLTASTSRGISGDHMRLYLAGPMTGYPEFNFPAFLSAAEMLRGEGHDVFCPAEHDLKEGFDPTGLAGEPWEMHELGYSLRQALGADLAWITSQAEGLVVLNGWSRSKGAVAEVATAQALSLPVWEFGQFVTFGQLAPKVGAAIHEMRTMAVV